MKTHTRKRKVSAINLKHLVGEDEFSLRLAQTISWRKKSIDSMNLELGRMLVESILLMDRENICGPDYAPSGDVYKWAHQGGSVYIGDRKVKISKPRLRDAHGEVELPSYSKLKESGQFSEEILTKVMSGLSARRYHETIQESASAFGVSPSSTSRLFIEATTKQLKEFLERSLSDFDPFAMVNINCDKKIIF